MHFSGCSSLSRGPPCYDPLSRHIYHSLDVTFFEDIPFYGTNPLLRELISHVSMEKESPSACPIPLFDSDPISCSMILSLEPPDDPLVVIPSSLVASSSRPLPLQTYSHHPHTPPLPEPPSVLGLSTPSPSPAPWYPLRTRHPTSRYGWFSSTNHPMSRHLSYNDLSRSYRSFLGTNCF